VVLGEVRGRGLRVIFRGLALSGVGFFCGGLAN